MPSSATGSETVLATTLGALTAGCLLVYLVWALVRPEDF